jgi:hypothetical protein
MTGNSNHIYEKLEHDRALAIIAKAERDNLNVVETLVSHMVSSKLIEQVTGKVPSWERAVRTDRISQIRAWAADKIGTTMKTAETSLLKSI